MEGECELVGGGKSVLVPYLGREDFLRELLEVFVADVAAEPVVVGGGSCGVGLFHGLEVGVGLHEAVELVRRLMPRYGY